MKLANSMTVKRPAFRVRVLQRVRSQSGDSLVEALVAVLISSLSILMLASVMASTVRIILDTNQKMEQYYAANVKLTKQEADDSSGVVSVTLESDPENVVESLGNVNLFKNTEYDEVVSYKIKTN
jgi:type II secretory pathway component PulJ